MHLTLTKKYILSYLLFGIGCFFLISTVTSNLIMKQVVVEKASAFFYHVVDSMPTISLNSTCCWHKASGGCLHEA